MTEQDTKVLNLLGKDVSFTRKHKINLTDKSLVTVTYDYVGTVTNVILSITGEPEISINDGDFYSLSELLDFKLI